MRCVIIGAGIVGLHAANALLLAGHEVYLLEKESYLAEHTSGRNSGVIHAGIFYDAGSFKESACVEGNALTYEWVRRLGVDHRACGKWVLAEAGQENELKMFFDRVCRLPIPTPRFMTPSELRGLEPALRIAPAVFIPSTGLVDAAGYVKAMARHVESQGAALFTGCEVTGADSSRLITSRGDIEFDLAVNCAGLFADEIARMSGLSDYEIKPCRGDYYVANAVPVRRPVYHLPVKGAPGLGVHLTPTLDGRTLLGPDACFIADKADYAHRSAPDAYRLALETDVPGTRKEIAPAYSGNRPKLFYRGAPLAEFTFIKRENWIHALGIESPGLTAAPVLGRRIAEMV